MEVFTLLVCEAHSTPQCVVCQRRPSASKWRHENFYRESEVNAALEDERLTSENLAKEIDVLRNAEEGLRAEVEDLQHTLQSERAEALATIRDLQAENAGSSVEHPS